MAAFISEMLKCLAVHLKFKATKALRRVINIHQSAENLKLLITEENNSDYLIIVQGYTGIYWILASMRMLICHLPPLHNSSDLPSNAKTAQEQLKEPSKETRMFNQNSKSTYLNWIEFVGLPISNNGLPVKPQNSNDLLPTSWFPSPRPCPYRPHKVGPWQN